MGQSAIEDPPCCSTCGRRASGAETAADELEEAGFHVLEAANADVALAVLEARSDEVRVLFTDMDMPGSMDGRKLAEQVHRRWPHVLLLISSGYDRPHPDEIPDHGQFMPKPITRPPWSGTSTT
jgi:two-component system, response regulator PdtaR